MKKLLFIERKYWGFVSIEKIFEQLSRQLSDRFDCKFRKVSYDNNLSGIIKNLLYFRKPDADVYHITGHIHYMALVLPRERTVLTIHDLGFLHIRKGLRRFLLKKLFLDWPLRRLKYVTAISQTTKDEILKYGRCPEERIILIENPLQEHFLVPAAAKFDADEPVILQIGALPNKNVARLVAALEGIRCRLRIVGRIDSTLAAEIKRFGILFENVYDLDDRQMREEYENADIVSFCSTYEGFGMPIIEAQAVGRPVVTSNIRPMTDVAGNGAVFVDPLDPDSIRKGILSVRDDAELRSSIVTEGFRNVARFDPKLIAGSFAELYNKVLLESGSK